MALIKWLNKPYPFIQNQKQILVLAICFGLFVVLFLGIFEPFGTYNIKVDKYQHLSGYGFCTAMGIFFNYLFLPRVFPNIINPEKWQIKKEIIFIFILLVVIAIFNYSYNKYLNPYKIRDISLLVFLGKTFSIGVFPVMLLTYFIERNLSHQNNIKAIELINTLNNEEESSKQDSEIIIKPDTIKSDPIQMMLNNFLFATSANNYTTVFYIKNSEPTSKLLRMSLKNLEEQMSHFNNIIRCHKSYLVNKDKIISVKGNARSLMLLLENYKQTIPVSRSFSKEQLL